MADPFEAEAREVLALLASLNALEHSVTVPESGPVSGYTTEPVPDNAALAALSAALRRERNRTVEAAASIAMEWRAPAPVVQAIRKLKVPDGE
jgi:hypothetical protein